MEHITYLYSCTHVPCDVTEDDFQAGLLGHLHGQGWNVHSVEASGFGVQDDTPAGLGTRVTVVTLIDGAPAAEAGDEANRRRQLISGWFTSRGWQVLSDHSYII